MAGYYKNLKNCFAQIKRTILESPEPVNYATLEYVVLENYGYGKKILNNMLEKLINASVIKVNKDGKFIKGDLEK